MPAEELPPAASPPDPPPAALGGSAPGGAGDADRSEEAYGPLALARHRKDDGRALILYSVRAQ